MLLGIGSIAPRRDRYGNRPLESAGPVPASIVLSCCSRTGSRLLFPRPGTSGTSSSSSSLSADRTREGVLHGPVDWSRPFDRRRCQFGMRRNIHVANLLDGEIGSGIRQLHAVKNEYRSEEHTSELQSQS